MGRVKLKANFILLASRYRGVFRDRRIKVVTLDRTDVIPVPDGELLCDICSTRLDADNVMVLFIAGHPWGAICEQCRQRYHPRLPLIAAWEV